MADIDRKWWKEAVVYQVYPRSFNDSNNDGIGDIKGITEKLPYIKTLGVDVIWLSPIYKSPMDDMGYDIADYRSIDPLFGTMEDFDELLAEAKKLGIKIVMDLVVNHTSDEHPWFLEAKKSKDNPYRDYYIWRDKPNNWSSYFCPSAWSQTEETEQYYLHLFAKKQPDLNWENPKVIEEVYDIMRFWLDKGIGGWRMDVISLISKPEGFPELPKGIHIGDWVGYKNRFHEFMQDMNKKVLSHYDIMTVGETPGATVDVALDTVAPERGELQTVFQFECMDFDHREDFWSYCPIDVNEWREKYHHWHKGLYNKGWQSNFLENHDQPRSVSRFGDDKEYRIESAKMLAMWNLTQCGTPYIYQGQELGMTNYPWASIEPWQDVMAINTHKEKQKNGESLADYFDGMAYRTRDNARTPMQWDETANAGFSDAKPWLPVNPNHTEINAKQALSDAGSILHFYSKLVTLRKNNLALIYGDQIMFDDKNENIIAYIRELEGEDSFLILLNFKGFEANVDLSSLDLEGYKLVLSNYDNPSQLQKITFLKPWECALFKKLSSS